MSDLLRELEEAAERDVVSSVHLVAQRREEGEGGERPEDLARVERLLREQPARIGETAETEDGPVTLLHLAAASHLPGVAAILLRHGADVDARDGGGNTPLLALLDQDYGEPTEEMERTVEVLVEAGADPGAQNRPGMSPAQLAAPLRDMEPGHRIYRLLCEGGPRGARDLNTAVKLGDVAAVRELLADPEALRKAPRPRALVEDAVALGRRTEREAVEILALLLVAGLHPDTSPHGSPGCTPLHAACGGGVPGAVVRLLLEYGADVNALYEGETPVDAARAVGRRDLVRILQGAGGKSGRTVRRGSGGKKPPG